MDMVCFHCNEKTEVVIALKLQVQRRMRSILGFFTWLALAVLIGGVLGVVGAAFHHGIELAGELRESHSWLIFLLPVAGLAIVASYQLLGMSDDRGTDFVISSVRDGKPLRFRTAPLIFLSTVLTHLCGGSAGREGAALQLGGCMSGYLGRVLRLKERRQRIITMCGMAAGFSALFGTPLAATIFAMEVESIGVMYYSALVPCTLAALTASYVAGFLGVSPTAFTLIEVPDLSPATAGQAIALGIAFGLIAWIFCRVMHTSSTLFRRVKNPYLRVVLGGAAVIVLSLFTDGSYNGAGMAAISAALAGAALPWAFALKLLFTALTLGSGYKGGEIVPSFFVGATLGCVVAPLLGMSAGFGGALGMIAVFCGVTNSPATSILLGYELFGGAGIGLMALCAGVSYLLSGYTSLYHTQAVVYSKTEPVLAEETENRKST